MFGQHLMSHEHGTLFEHMVHSLTGMQPANGVGLIWFTETRSLVYKASSLRITLANLASFAM